MSRPTLNFFVCRCGRDVWNPDRRLRYCRHCRKERSKELKRRTWHRNSVIYLRQKALRQQYPYATVQYIRLKMTEQSL